MQPRSLGVTVLPEYIQNEGPDRVLDGLASRGVSAVSTSPYVMEPSGPAHGSREPPADGGSGKVRLLDRPLWGRRELFVRTAPSFTPDRRLYAGLPYQPPEPDALTATSGALVADFIRAAKERGLKVYLQIQAAIPPGYRVQFGGPRHQDMPRLPDGRLRQNGIDKNASLASLEVRAYGSALIRDLCRAYPEIDGLRIDWPEYPPYDLDSLFFDCSEHAFAAGERLGFDVARMRKDMAAAYAHVNGGLSPRDLENVSGGAWMGTLRARMPGFADMLSLKAELVRETLATFRATLTEAGGPDKELVPQAFPPPWSALSGFDYALASPSCDRIGVKLYTMHWPMIVRNVVEALISRNPGLGDPEAVLRLVLRGLDLDDPEHPVAFASLRYPEPDEPHWTGGPGAQERKLAAARRSASRPIIALAHGYGPAPDVRARVAAAFRECSQVWVNRYGYLSDEKLDLLGELVRAAPASTPA